MKLIFCTLFDSNYLTRGLVLYDSLVQKCNDFHLYIFAFDDNCNSVLKKMSLPNITVISLKEYEDDELLKVKKDRSVAEYCWTNTPSTVWYVLNNFEVTHCTYIDADILFYSNPTCLIQEMGEKSILITEHRYSNPGKLIEKAGIYNVQFITFKNNSIGREVCNWWRRKCLDWCFDRFEDGKFGDQKYLDDWPERFTGVHVLKNEGGGLATWNIQQYDIINSNENQVVLKSKKNRTEFPVIFYHFHALKFYKNNIVFISPDYLSKKTIKTFYWTYIKLLNDKRTEIINQNKEFEEKINLTSSPFTPLKLRDIIYLYRKEVLNQLLKLNFNKAVSTIKKIRVKIKMSKLYNYHCY
jgi:hypothetical protein